MLRLSAQHDIEALKKRLLFAKHDTSRIALLLKISELENNDSLAIAGFRKAQMLMQNASQANSRADLGYRFFSLQANDGLAKIYRAQGNVPAALDEYKAALATAEVMRDSAIIAEYYNKIGLMHQRLADIPRAIDFFQRALKFYERMNDVQGIAACYDNIGGAYFEQGEFQMAVDYNTKGLSLLEKSGDKLGVAGSLNNLGVLYRSKVDIDKAYEYYSRCLEILKQSDEKYGMATILGNMAVINNLRGKSDLALQDLKQSLRLFEELGDQESIASALVDIGGIYFERGDQQQAFTFAKRAFDISKQNSDPQGLLLSSKALYKYYESNNKGMEALQMFQLYIKMRDSISNTETRKLSIKKQFQYEYEKRAAADSIRNHERIKIEELKHAEAISRQRTYTYGGILGFGLMLLVAVISFRAYRNKKKANMIIMEQKKITEDQKSLIEEKQKEIIDSITYARRIQRSLLPTKFYIEKNLARLRKS